MDQPQDRRYAPTHEWARQEADGSLTIGISDYAQEALGDVVYLELPEPGRVLEVGEACALIESVKAASDIHAPVAGTVLARNEAAVQSPESINADPYGQWLFRLSPAKPSAFECLLSAKQYADTLNP
jgi:glycine cleavage system H protein